MLVDSMLDEVRNLADEANTSDVSDADILASLNRAQQKLVRIATRKYNPIFMREATISSFSGREATIPEYAYGLKINSIDVIQGSNAYPVLPAQIRKMSALETSGTSSIPSHYTLRGDKILLYPTPSSGVSLRVRYQVRPPELVKQQGRITDIDSLASDILYVDSLGSDLTTSIDNLKAFVNIIDGTTGLVKDTAQISAIDTTNKKLTFKSSSLDRTLVWGQTVGTSLSTDIALDDYVTIANGTCIPTLTRDYSDFLIQYAVVEVLNRLGIPSQEAYAHLKELEDDVSRMWSGRPSNRRVTQRSKHWGRRLRISR